VIARGLTPLRSCPEKNPKASNYLLYGLPLCGRVCPGEERRRPLDPNGSRIGLRRSPSLHLTSPRALRPTPWGTRSPAHSFFTGSAPITFPPGPLRPSTTPGSTAALSRPRSPPPAPQVGPGFGLTLGFLFAPVRPLFLRPTYHFPHPAHPLFFYRWRYLLILRTRLPLRGASSFCDFRHSVSLPWAVRSSLPFFISPFPTRVSPYPLGLFILVPHFSLPIRLGPSRRFQASAYPVRLSRSRVLGNS